MVRERAVNASTRTLSGRNISSAALTRLRSAGRGYRQPDTPRSFVHPVTTFVEASTSISEPTGIASAVEFQQTVADAQWTTHEDVLVLGSSVGDHKCRI